MAWVPPVQLVGGENNSVSVIRCYLVLAPTGMPAYDSNRSGIPGLCLLVIVLVVDLADQLLQQVLESKHPGSLALFVFDDGNLHTLLSKFVEQRRS